MCFTGRLPIWRRQSPVNGRELASFSWIRTRCDVFFAAAWRAGDFFFQTFLIRNDDRCELGDSLSDESLWWGNKSLYYQLLV